MARIAATCESEHLNHRDDRKERNSLEYPIGLFYYKSKEVTVRLKRFNLIRSASICSLTRLCRSETKFSSKIVLHCFSFLDFLFPNFHFGHRLITYVSP